MKTNDFDRLEKIVGKGENGGYQHFHLFSQCFEKAFFFWVVKSRDHLIKGSHFTTQFCF